MASAPGFEHLYDSDECDLEAGGYCCGSGLYNNVFPGQCRICEDENTVGCRPSSFYLRRVPEKASGGEMAVVRLTLFSIGAGIAVSWLV
jgi:predicted metal-binding protein